MANRRIDSPPEPEKPKILSCAIYTRKSTDENLSTNFNSLDPQRVRITG